MDSSAEFFSDVKVPLTLDLSADASTYLVDGDDPVTPTSRFRRRRRNGRAHQMKKVNLCLLCLRRSIR